jgi:hypothetical protein
MPRIRCHYLDCAFLDDGYCSAASVEVDPDAGCMTYSPTADLSSDEGWDEEEDLEEWEEAEEDDETEDDVWLDEEDESF